MVVDADPESALLAVKVTPWSPTSPGAGVQVSVPLVLPGPGLKDAPAREVAVSEAIGFPSGSAALTLTTIAAPTCPLAVAGALTTGGRSASSTVIAVLAVPGRALVAVKVAVCAPASPAPGVQVRVPVVFPGPGVKAAPAGSPDIASDVIESPSGSEAVTGTVSTSAIRTTALAGATTTGGRSTLFTVIAVVVEPCRALVAVNVTV